MLVLVPSTHSLTLSQDESCLFWGMFREQTGTSQRRAVHVCVVASSLPARQIESSQWGSCDHADNEVISNRVSAASCLAMTGQINELEEGRNKRGKGVISPSVLSLRSSFLCLVYLVVVYASHTSLHPVLTTSGAPLMLLQRGAALLVAFGDGACFSPSLVSSACLLFLSSPCSFCHE